ncbi:MAG: T9SS type A sorting domain-containing protein [candidate division WOR-3 bacterium]
MLQIYPNPARSVLALRIPQSTDRQAISIFDVSGEVIKEAVSLRNDREIKIALKGINPGVYFLRVGRKITKFIVVR